MSAIGDAVLYLNDPLNWTKVNGILDLLVEHLTISVSALLAAVVIALPLAVWFGHTGRGGGFTVALSNVSRAVPTLALLTLFAVTPIGFGNRATAIALALFAIPPILTNTYVAVRGIDHELRDAAEGMGMYGSQVLRQLEVPLAMPLIMAGIRTSAVQVVATATLAAFVSLGGLGRYIFDGLGQQVYAEVAAGAILVAVLALTVEYLLSKLQTAMTARGLRSGQRDDPMAPKTTATPA